LLCFRAGKTTLIRFGRRTRHHQRLDETRFSRSASAICRRHALPEIDQGVRRARDKVRRSGVLRPPARMREQEASHAPGHLFKMLVAARAWRAVKWPKNGITLTGICDRGATEHRHYIGPAPERFALPSVMVLPGSSTLCIAGVGLTGEETNRLPPRPGGQPSINSGKRTSLVDRKSHLEGQSQTFEAARNRKKQRDPRTTIQVEGQSSRRSITAWDSAI